MKKATDSSAPVTLQPAQLVWKVCKAPERMHSCTQRASRTIFVFFPAYWRYRFWPDSLCGSTAECGRVVCQ